MERTTTERKASNEKEEKDGKKVQKGNKKVPLNATRFAFLGISEAIRDFSRDNQQIEKEAIIRRAAHYTGTTKRLRVVADAIDFELLNTLMKQG